MEKLQENLLKVKENIAQAARRSGRNVEEITLVAVTKTVSAEVTESALSLGIRDIGENFVQDAWEKHGILSKSPLFSQVRWHMIGHLQTNKVKAALSIFHMIHSIDSVKLAEEVDRRCTRTIPVLIQVNVSGEESKHGFSEEELSKSFESLLKLSHLSIQGLMTMAPLDAGEDSHGKNICRKCFSRLRELSMQYNVKYKGSVELKHLSMGMSQDYEIAIEEGATLVRVGSQIFKI